MHDALSELNKRFIRLMEIQDPLDFFHALEDYLLFVEETSPFNTIVRESQTLSTLAFEPFYPFRKFKESLDRRSREARGSGGVDTGVFFVKDQVRPFLHSFHSRLLKGAQERGLKSKATIVLNEREAHIYIATNPSRVYAIRRENPQRFQIVKLLKRAPQSARMLAEHFFSKEDREHQNYIKQQIVFINTLFRKHVIAEDLIVHEKQKGRNIYALNPAFLYRAEK